MKQDQNHESYGIMTLSRGQGSPMPLFGSSILHQNHIRIEIKTAALSRQLSQDSIHDNEVLLIAIMSPAQFSDAITGINQGSGVPITLQYVKGDRNARPTPPAPQRQQQFQEELRENLQGSLEQMDEIIKASKGSMKRKLQSIRQRMEHNLPFLQDQFAHQMERSVTEAKAEIETFLTQRERQDGKDKPEDRTPALPTHQETPALPTHQERDEPR